MTQGATTAVDRVSPLRDPSRRARMVKVVSWIGGLAVLAILLDLVGLDVLGWLDQLSSPVPRSRWSTPPSPASPTRSR